MFLRQEQTSNIQSWLRVIDKPAYHTSILFSGDLEPLTAILRKTKRSCAEYHHSESSVYNKIQIKTPRTEEDHELKFFSSSTSTVLFLRNALRRRGHLQDSCGRNQKHRSPILNNLLRLNTIHMVPHTALTRPIIRNFLRLNANTMKSYHKLKILRK